ncbi:Protein CBG10602 [Caenorhabditis briggsae]|uniref:Protein CBG10602 n=3 Tax=Caenorhabditis briggsae TaxID=6238 RepID=A8XBG2_CAEBR|nr:Protein CBG10602 [Caenorhabditis briggsae]CAP29977.2 Protein CBG10602 [Caenorhabditis briggsae]
MNTLPRALNKSRMAVIIDKSFLKKKELESCEFILSLFKHGGSMFSQNNKDNFEDSVSSYGKKSYLRTLQLIKEKSSSTTISHGNIDFDTEHTTILQYLKSQGFNAGRMPPNPVVADDMIMEN